MSTDTLSLIIPTYNMAEHLVPLWNSIKACGLLGEVSEVLFVDDGSTDATSEVLSLIAKTPAAATTTVRILRSEKNQGRFLTRLWGAREATGRRLLFVDTRITLPSDFGAALAELRGQFEQLCVCVDIDIRRNIFCLYWDRSHRALFRKHYRDTQQPLKLVPENFDQYLSGTTTLLCLKDLFLNTCQKYESSPLLNDDVTILKEMIQVEPLVIHPRLRIQWVPRETALEFLKRLWERGPSFVEYHVFKKRRGAFFWIPIFGAALTVGWFFLLLLQPVQALSIFLGFLGAVILSTAAFAQGPIEFCKLALLHTATVFTFGMGILRGLVLNSFRVLSGRRSSAA